MIKTNKKRGFSLIELLIGIIVAGIVILMISAVGTIAYQSYNNLRNQSGVYNDSQFALQLIREGIRQSTSVPTIAGTCLTIVTAASTKYYYTMTSGTTKSLVYGSNACSSATNEPIISGVTSTGFVFTPSVTGQLVTVALSGTKNGVSFNYSMSAMRRNP